MPDVPFTMSRCPVCRQELTAITRCEKDGHRGHHAHCCPDNRAAPPGQSRPARLLGGLRSRR